MAESPTYDFPVISDDERGQAGPSLEEAQFGDTVLREETVYEDVGGDWRNGEHGREIGTVTLTQAPTTVKGRIRLRAWFVFNNGETVEYGGLVPGNGSWKGKGRMGFKGGTGKFSDRRDELDLESTNPKRWG